MYVCAFHREILQLQMTAVQSMYERQLAMQERLQGHGRSSISGHGNHLQRRQSQTQQSDSSNSFMSAAAGIGSHSAVSMGNGSSVNAVNAGANGVSGANAKEAGTGVFAPNALFRASSGVSSSGGSTASSVGPTPPPSLATSVAVSPCERTIPSIPHSFGTSVSTTGMSGASTGNAGTGTPADDKNSVSRSVLARTSFDATPMAGLRSALAPRLPLVRTYHCSTVGVVDAGVAHVSRIGVLVYAGRCPLRSECRTAE